MAGDSSASVALRRRRHRRRRLLRHLLRRPAAAGPRARGRGQWRRLLVVDRDPACRFARETRRPAPGAELVVEDWGALLRPLPRRRRRRRRRRPADAIVPSPLMPHLMYEWLLRRAGARWPGPAWSSRGPSRPARARRTTCRRPTAPDTSRSPTGSVPSTASSPRPVPVIRAPRTWEMADAMARASAGGSAAPPDRRPGAVHVSPPGVRGGDVRRRRRCWRGMRSSARPARPGRRSTSWSPPSPPAMAPPACCTWARAKRESSGASLGSAMIPRRAREPPVSQPGSGREHPAVLYLTEPDDGERDEPYRGVRSDHRRRRARRALRRACTPAAECSRRCCWSAACPAASCSTPSGSTTTPVSSTSSGGSWRRR